MKIPDFNLGQKIGPTGRYPYGRIGATDRGELTVRVFTDRAHGWIRVDFGTELTWVSLPPDVARQFATELTERADVLDPEKRQAAGTLPALMVLSTLREHSQIKIEFGRTEVGGIAMEPGVARTLATAILTHVADLDRHTM